MINSSLRKKRRCCPMIHDEVIASKPLSANRSLDRCLMISYANLSNSQAHLLNQLNERFHPFALPCKAKIQLTAKANSHAISLSIHPSIWRWLERESAFECKLIERRHLHSLWLSLTSPSNCIRKLTMVR